MAYLPLILLVSAAFFSGAAALSFIIAIRSSREHRNTIFPVVREVEGLKAKWAWIGVFAFMVLSASTVGGWVATQGNVTNTPLVPSIARRASDTLQLDLSVLLTSSETKELAEPVVQVDTSLATATVPVFLDISTDMPEPTSELNAVVLATHTPSITLIDPTSTSPQPSATPTPIPTSTVEPTATPEPTVAVPSSSTPAPTPTSINLPSPTVSPITTSPQEERRSISQIPNSVKIGPIVFAHGVTNRRRAIDPTDVFAHDIEQIYAVFPYSGMRNGMQFSVIWYYQEEEILRDEYEWNWGSEDRSYAFIKPQGPGNYEVEMKINSETIASGSFEVRP